MVVVSLTIWFRGLVTAQQMSTRLFVVVTPIRYKDTLVLMPLNSSGNILVLCPSHSGRGLDSADSMQLPTLFGVMMDLSISHVSTVSRQNSISAVTLRTLWSLVQKTFSFGIETRRLSVSSPTLTSLVGGQRFLMDGWGVDIVYSLV